MNLRKELAAVDDLQVPINNLYSTALVSLFLKFLNHEFLSEAQRTRYASSKWLQDMTLSSAEPRHIRLE
jgi:hypothetical protein